MVSTEDLIEELSRDLQPVRVRRSSDAMALAWWGLVLVAAAGLLLATGPWRPGALQQLLAAPRFALEVGLGLLVCGMLAICLFRLATPGRSSRRGGYWLAVLVLLWLGVLCWNALAPPLYSGMAGKRPHCFAEVMVLAMLPALHGIWLLHRRYPLQPLRIAVGTALLAGLAPALLMQLACMYEPAHNLLFHWLPVVVLGVVAAVLAGLWRGISG